MTLVYRPSDESELAGVIAHAAGQHSALELAGAGTKRGIGMPVAAQSIVSTVNLRGITLYEPSELVMSALSGTPIEVVEQELAKYNQELAFEPSFYANMFPQGEGRATIGGIFATNASGPRRIYAGAARDHLLGLRGVNGVGEIFKSGGRVMKNVTGYDLCRTLSGSWGTLAVLSEVTFKVVPKAEECRTLLLFGQPDVIAGEVMCAALGTPYEVSGTVHLQQAMAERLSSSNFDTAGKAVTALRLENFSNSVAYRMERLKEQFSAYGDVAELDHARSLGFWQEIRDFVFLPPGATPIWRISTAPTMGPRTVEAISRFMDCHAVYDWSAGLVWLDVPQSGDAGAADIRRVVATLGGHATLIRAQLGVRESVDVFHPMEAGVKRLSKAVKSVFDPRNILNPGRMYRDL